MAFFQNDVTYIKHLEYFEEEDGTRTVSSLILTFICESKTERYEAIVKFIDVTSFKLDFGGSGAIQITGFEILDISNKQWDTIRYQVEDWENGIIFFYCKAYEVIK